VPVPTYHLTGQSDPRITPGHLLLHSSFDIGDKVFSILGCHANTQERNDVIAFGVEAALKANYLDPRILQREETGDSAVDVSGNPKNTLPQ